MGLSGTVRIPIIPSSPFCLRPHLLNPDPSFLGLYPYPFTYTFTFPLQPSPLQPSPPSTFPRLRRRAQKPPLMTRLKQGWGSHLL